MPYFSTLAQTGEYEPAIEHENLVNTSAQPLHATLAIPLAHAQEAEPTTRHQKFCGYAADVCHYSRPECTQEKMSP